MENQELYHFLTAKCKQKGIRIEAMPELCELSRSTLYRYMKGINRMTPKVQSKFSEVLQLDDSERQALDRLIDLTEFDSSLLAARFKLDKLFFSKQAPTQEPVPIKFAYYNNDIFLRTSSEIFDMMLALSDLEGAVCRLSIVNCMGTQLSKTVIPFLGTVLNAKGQISVEHLISFSDRDYLKNANILIDIMPLMKYKSYAAHYCEVSIPDNVKMMFQDAIIAEMHMPNEQSKYFLLSFLDGDLSVCHTTLDKYAYIFALSNYEHLKKDYNAAMLVEQVMQNVIQDTIIELEESYNSYLIKSNNCYDKIPIDVYRGLVNRTSQDDIDALVRSFTLLPDNVPVPNGAIDSVLALMERRIASSYIRQRVDIYSTEGLTALAQTGKLTDHFSYIPVFNPSERRRILEYIRDRNNDANDKYRLFITTEKIYDNEFIIVVFEGFGICIEYMRDDVRAEIHDNLIIRNKMISELFVDYAKNHVPSQHAMNDDEANVYLDGLIESCRLVS